MPDADNLDEVALTMATNRVAYEISVDLSTPEPHHFHAERIATAAVTAYLSEAPTHKLYRSTRTKLATSEQEVERLRTALKNLAVALITVKPRLDTPYDDRPEWTPWTRFVERPFERAGAALTPSVEGGE